MFKGSLIAKPAIDTRDIRCGAYDPINKDGLPRSEQIRDKATPHAKAQWDADSGLSLCRERNPCCPRVWSGRRRGR